MARTNGRTRPSSGREHEMRELLALREREGWTVRELSAASGVPPGTLSWWSAEIRRRDAARAAEAPLDFVEVVVDAVERHDGDDALHFEVTLREGRRVRVPSRYGLGRLVRELEGC